VKIMTDEAAATAEPEVTRIILKEAPAGKCAPDLF
jgi:hypothetical protein